ncbi:MAG: acylphosphatase [Ignavibacteria bacterium]|jgi:acylphosphatase|nr:acylphosphatase [Ignavibacteria bacterium]MCU7504814.1 acylphosphatase [Ignavibacteria bacterium]MCU7517700.1 acylphosphatase [Ignavibacteria bacterium]
MEGKLFRAEILAEGMVQGVGFRYFVLRNAQRLGLKGYTRNLYTGDEVLTVVEGSKAAIEELFKTIRIGPMHASVNRCTIAWQEYSGEFSSFEIRH